MLFLQGNTCYEYMYARCPRSNVNQICWRDKRGEKRRREKKREKRREKEREKRRTGGGEEENHIKRFSCLLLQSQEDLQKPKNDMHF